MRYKVFIREKKRIKPPLILAGMSLRKWQLKHDQSVIRNDSAYKSSPSDYPKAFHLKRKNQYVNTIDEQWRTKNIVSRVGRKNAMHHKLHIFFKKRFKQYRSFGEIQFGFGGSVKGQMSKNGSLDLD